MKQGNNTNKTQKLHIYLKTTIKPTANPISSSLHTCNLWPISFCNWAAHPPFLIPSLHLTSPPHNILWASRKIRQKRNILELLSKPLPLRTFHFSHQNIILTSHLNTFSTMLFPTWSITLPTHQHHFSRLRNCLHNVSIHRCWASACSKRKVSIRGKSLLCFKPLLSPTLTWSGTLILISDWIHSPVEHSYPLNLYKLLEQTHRT